MFLWWCNLIRVAAFPNGLQLGCGRVRRGDLFDARIAIHRQIHSSFDDLQRLWSVSGH